MALLKGSFPAGHALSRYQLVMPLKGLSTLQELLGELEAVGSTWLDERHEECFATRLPARWRVQRRALAGRGEAAHVLADLDWFDGARRRWGLSGPQVPPRSCCMPFGSCSRLISGKPLMRSAGGHGHGDKRMLSLYHLLL